MQWLDELLDGIRYTVTPVSSVEATVLREWILARVQSEIEAKPVMSESILTNATNEMVSSVWMDTVTDNSHRAIAAMNVRTLQAIQSAALQYPSYRVLPITMRGVIKDYEYIRSVAVLYGPLSEQGLSPAMYRNALHNLHAVHPSFKGVDFSKLSPEKLEQARAVMHLVAYDLKKYAHLSSKPAREMLANRREGIIPGGVINILMEAPEKATSIIDFMTRRDVDFENVDAEVLGIALDSASESLNGGVL